jgi:regulatory protein YycH of two-component signal transduction system YycFG
MYKFKKLDVNDEFMLSYNKKQIKFKRTVKTAQRLQSIDSEARFKVIKKITDMGYTMDNNPFIVTKTEGNKTYKDESNFNYLIEQEKQYAMAEIIAEIVKDTMGMEFDDLILDMGIDPNDADALLKFTTDFMYIIKNGEVFGTKKTPSSNN